LLTGGAGFIGSHLTDALVERGDEVMVFDDLSTGHLRNIQHLLGDGRVTFVEGSTTDEVLVDDLMRQVDGCFHLASAVGVQLICERPLESLLKNVRGCDNVIGAASRHDVRLLYTSTSEIYGKDSVGSLTEESDRLLGSPQKGRWSYATAKVFGEMLAFGYGREHDADMIVVRLFNTVGPRQTGAYGMVVPNFVRQALAEESITVFGDGLQSRCFAHVFDSVAGILALFDNDDAVGEVFNIGASMEITISELASKVVERCESTSEISYVPFEEAYDEGFEELGRRKPDTSALEGLTGWRQKLTIDDAIDDVMAWQRAHHAQVDAEPGELVIEHPPA
jgi:UDP-glucose 4-epimerase